MPDLDKNESKGSREKKIDEMGERNWWEWIVNVHLKVKCKMIQEKTRTLTLSLKKKKCRAGGICVYTNCSDLPLVPIPMAHDLSNW